MNRKAVLWILGLLALVVIAIGIYSTQKRDAGAETLKIGVIAPLTGEGADYGNAMKQGIEMAIAEINAKGGINGRKLEAVYEDDKLQPKEGVSAFRKLVTMHKVPVIIGSAASRVTLSIAPVAEEQRVVLLSSISTADALRDAGDYIFRNVPPNRLQGRTAAQFVLQYLQRKRAGLIYKNDDYGASLAEAFRQYYREGGGTIVFDEPYGVDQQDFRPLLSKLKAAQPEVVFMPGNYQDNAIILKQARELGLTMPFIGGDGAFSTELIKLAGKAAENSYYTMMGVPKNERVEAFVRDFKSRYNTQEEPNVFVFYAYDAMMVVAKAIEKGGYNAEGIKNALYTVDHDGITGPIKFDQYGEVDKSYSIYTVKNNQFVLLDWQPK